MAPVIRFATRRTARIAAVLAVVGLAGTAVAIALEPQRALLAYLAAFCTVFAVAAGALILLLIGHAANTRWLSPPRRLIQALASVFPLLAVLFVPIALGVAWIYPWTDPGELPPVAQRAVDAKAGWLAVGPFIARGFAYLVVCGIAAEMLRRWSARRDPDEPAAEAPPEPPPEAAEASVARERAFASAMLIPVGLAVTFAAFDWLMSLQPAWTSTMFGVYLFAAGFSAALALIAILGRRSPALTPHHYHALGRMLLAFVVFWAYTAYFQGFLIQIADKPSEVTFYIARTRGGWYGVLWAVVLARFALPFLLLLPRAPKFLPGYVAAVAGVVVVGHVLDIYWLVLPSAGGPVAPALCDAAAYLGVVASCVAFAAWRFDGVPIVCAGDPFLAAGSRYESPT